MRLLKATRCHLQEERHKVVLSGKVKADEHRMRCHSHTSGWEDHAPSNLKLVDFSTGVMNGYDTWVLRVTQQYIFIENYKNVHPLA